MTTIDGSEITEVTIDGEQVREITMDGDIVWQWVREIDTFEIYNGTALSDNWTLDGSGDSVISSNAALHANSTQGVAQSGTAQLRSFPGDGLPNYPEDGAEHMVLMRPNDSTVQPHVLINLDSDTWSTDSGNGNWRFEFHMTSGIRIVYHDGSTREILASDSDYEWTIGDIYDIRFRLDSSSGVELWVFDNTGTEVARASTTDTRDIDPEMNIGLRTDAGVHWDWPHIVPDGHDPQA